MTERAHGPVVLAGRGLRTPLRIALILTLVPFASCASAGGVDVEDTAPFFPPGSFYREALFDAFLAEYYSASLRGMQEPSLRPIAGQSQRACRFLWLRSFHDPIAVRIEEREGVLVATSAMLDGIGRFDGDSMRFVATPLGHRVERPVTETSWRELSESIDRAGFWTADPPSEDEMIQVDGAVWILEVVDGRRWRAVNQVSPPPTGANAAFRELCLRLLVLGGVEVPAEEVY